MGSNGGDEVMISGSDEAKCSEATVEIKIKTLDSQTYTLQMDKCVPVPALKEQIATVTGVLSEQQRLICSGKVLKDDQLLSAYHVEDGHTLHLVVRQPIPPSLESSPDHPGNNASSDGTQDGQEFSTPIHSEVEQLLSSIFPGQQIHDLTYLGMARIPAAVLTGTTQDVATSQEAAPRENDEGLFLSNVLHQIMPIISENTSRSSPEDEGDIEDRNTQASPTQAQEHSDRGVSNQLGNPPSSSSAKHQRSE